MDGIRANIRTPNHFTIIAFNPGARVVAKLEDKPRWILIRRTNGIL